MPLVVALDTAVHSEYAGVYEMARDLKLKIAVTDQSGRPMAVGNQPKVARARSTLRHARERSLCERARR